MKLLNLSLCYKAAVHPVWFSPLPTSLIMISQVPLRVCGCWSVYRRRLWPTQSETPKEPLKASCEVVENATIHFLSYITTIKTVFKEKHNESSLDSWVTIETCATMHGNKTILIIYSIQHGDTETEMCLTEEELLPLQAKFYLSDYKNGSLSVCNDLLQRHDPKKIYLFKKVYLYSRNIKCNSDITSKFLIVN